MEVKNIPYGIQVHGEDLPDNSFTQNLWEYFSILPITLAYLVLPTWLVYKEHPGYGLAYLLVFALRFKINLKSADAVEKAQAMFKQFYPPSGMYEWSNCEEFPRQEWVAVVAAGDTNRGYWSWVNAKTEERV